jgi:hypothetical protein
MPTVADGDVVRRLYQAIADLVDVAIGERYVVAVQHATASNAGKVLDVTACQLITVRDGLINEVRGHYSDQEALDAFWQ